MAEQTAAEQARDAIARAMHDAYEDAATREGWETNPASRTAWDDLPDANRRTMQAAIAAVLRDPDVLGALADHLATVAPDTLLDALAKKGTFSAVHHSRDDEDLVTFVSRAYRWTQPEVEP